MKDKNEYRPLSYLDKEDAKRLIDEDILYANDKEGLGCYGILKEFDDEKGKFIVEQGFEPFNLIRCNWIVKERE